ncbi:MAG: amidohydrolase family protein [Nitrososphaeraceae archaeon]|nr:amidohydrolase family protein [Nitrososphaeraceae archaeon]
MIIDAHCHLFEHFVNMKGLKIEKMIEQIECNGIDKIVLFTSEGLHYDTNESNNNVAESASHYPKKVIPFGTINPWHGQGAIIEMDRCINELGLKGFKLHPWATGFPINSELMIPIAHKANELGVPIIIHSGTPPWSEPFQIAEFAQMVPNVPIIMGHMGLPDLWKEAIVAAKQNSNIFLETSGAHTLSIKKAVEYLGPNRVIFGSDMPFGGKENQKFQLEKIRLIQFDKETQSKILGGNIAQILWKK